MSTFNIWCRFGGATCGELAEQRECLDQCYDKQYLSYARIPRESWAMVRYSIFRLMYFPVFLDLYGLFVMSPRQMRPTDRLGPLFTASMYV